MRVYSLLIALSLLDWSVPVWGQQQPLVGYIEGAITDQRGTPIPYAMLTATNIDSVEPESHQLTTSADGKGIFNFVELSPAHYSIQVQKKGYRDYKVPSVTVRPGERVKMPEIRMIPVNGH